MSSEQAVTLLGDDIYEVEEIVGMKKVDCMWLYRVRWKGYGSHSDTWEPEENLLLCRDMIDEYKTKLAEKTARRQAREGPLLTRDKHSEKTYSPPSENRVVESLPSSNSFWKEVSEGKVRVLEEDMYSRVKGRAAKRALNVKPGQWAHSKKRKSGVLQTLSQSYDNSMKSVEDSRSFRTGDGQPTAGTIGYLAKLRLVQQPVEVTSPSTKENKDILKREVFDAKRCKSLRWYVGDLDSEESVPCEGDDVSELAECIHKGDWDLLPVLLKPHRVWEDVSSLQLLIAGVSRGSGCAVRAMAAAGLNLNVATKDSTTALMFASQNGQSEVVLELLKAGALTDLQNAKGETALMLACSGGFVETVRHLLHYGANFSTLDRQGMSALRLAKVGRHSDIQELLTYQLARLTAAFELEVRQTVSDTAHIVHAVFPLRCFSLNEQADFTITFNHELQPLTPGAGYLLFVAHASISTEGVQCRLYGPCSVLSVTLNGAKQPPLTEEANFVFSFSPLSDGLNTVTISTLHNPKSMVKLLVCAYKAVLNPEAASRS